MKTQHFNEDGTLMVSTVDLGQAFQDAGLGAFETVVFRLDADRPEYGAGLFCERYDTEDLAVLGHAFTVERAKAGDFDN